MDLYDMMEQIESDGYVTVVCAECGTEHDLEPDGETVCGCGALVRSPLLDLGMI